MAVELKMQPMAPELVVTTGGVTAPRGFTAAAVHAGLKKSNRLDLALIYSQTQSRAAAVYTQNRVQAAPIVVTKQHLGDGLLQAVVINSGNANACTGKAGLEAATTMAEVAGTALGIPASLVAVASTGVIGVPLPVDLVCRGIEQAAHQLCDTGGEQAAQAILTTDTFVKQIAVEVDLNGKLVTIGGMAKGSGMIHPNMATMLAFITTDAQISSQALDLALRAAVSDSFNMITIDGDTSTNDMVLAMANGRAGNHELGEGAPGWSKFNAALRHVCIYLARCIARDGEGASKLIEVLVKGARSTGDARLAARSIAGSNLVKAAIFGSDANWGRILAAVGYSGAAFNPDQVDIFLGAASPDDQDQGRGPASSAVSGIKVASGGAGLQFDENEAKKILSNREVTITVDLREGDGEARAWGCDLTYGYVRINAEYRS